jgi:uncharacterized protein (TIRG00374 family)
LVTSKRFWFGLIITAGFLGFFLYRTDFRGIVDAFRGADYWLAIASVPLYFVGFWIRTIRWRVLMRPVRDVPTRRMYPVVLIGLMANNVMPARVGELVRAYLIGERENVSKSAALGTIAVDRVFDGLTLVAILAAVTVFTGTDANVRGIGVGAGLVFLAATAVLAALAFSPKKARGLAIRLINVLPHGLEERLEDLMDNFLSGLQSLRSPSMMMLAGALSVASWTVETSMYYLVGQAFHLDVGFEVYYLIAAAANLALSILASPGGVGPFEVTTQAILIDLYGVSSGSAEAFALALHALLLGPVILVGFWLLWASQASFSDILGVRKKVESEEDEPAAVLSKAEPAVE